MNWKSFFCILSVVVATFVHAEPNTEARLIGKKWADMDYGPAMKLTLQVSKDNDAHKGLAIRLDPGVGGISSGTEFMVFDTDTLRWAGAWTSDTFINWRNIALDGKHGVHASITGDLAISNPIGPGWGRPKDGYLKDDRTVGRDGSRYGPLARDWGHWKGHYVHGNQVVLSYTIGDTEVLELPGAEGSEEQRVFSRTLNIGARENRLYIRIQQGKPLQSINNNILKSGELYLAPVKPPKGVSWTTTKDQRGALLSIPTGNDAVQVKVLMPYHGSIANGIC